ncbi:MAG: hypothetical protein V1709_00920 [Planctomycetota bacterium]
MTNIKWTTRKTQKNTQAKWIMIKTAYIEREDEPSMNQLAQEYGISQAQLGRLAKKENWLLKRKDHWDKIGIKILKKCSTETADRLLRNQKIVEGALSYLVQQIRYKTIKCTLSDLEKLIRTDEFLHGNADSRTETVITAIERAILDNQNRRVSEYETVNEIEAELTGAKPGQPLLSAPEEEEDID